MKLGNNNTSNQNGLYDDQKLVNHPISQPQIGSVDSDMDDSFDKEEPHITTGIDGNDKNTNNLNLDKMKKDEKKESGETPETSGTPSKNVSPESTDTKSVVEPKTPVIDDDDLDEFFNWNMTDTTDDKSVGSLNLPETDMDLEKFESVESTPPPEVITQSQTVLKVKITDLKPNPLNGQIYTNLNVDDLLENIIENGGVIHTPILVTKNLVPIDGNRRIECCKLLGIEEIEVIVRDIIDSMMDLMMVSSNINRLKTGEEIYNEIQILKKYYGNRQGMRTDLITEVGGSEGKNEDTQTKISKTLKVSKGTMTQLNDIFKHNPEYLKEIDNINVKTNTIHSKVLREQNEQKEKERLEKLINNEYEFKPKVFESSPKDMMKFVSNDTVDEIITTIPQFKLFRYDNDVRPEIGWEKTVEEYIDNLVPIFQNCYKVLKDTGSFFLNVSDDRDDSGCELNIPHRVLEHMKKLGFLCVQTIIWEKTNPPSTGNQDTYRDSFEYIFHLTKSTNFKTKGLMKSMKRNVVDEQKSKFDESYLIYNGKRWDESWIRGDLVRTSVTKPIVDDEETVGLKYPNPLIDVIPVPMVLDFTDEGDTILDPFCGIGTVGLISLNYSREFIGFETNSKLQKITRERLNQKMKSLNMTKE